jgi:hypothetical protein
VRGESLYQLLANCQVKVFNSTACREPLSKFSRRGKDRERSLEQKEEEKERGSQIRNSLVDGPKC